MQLLPLLNNLLLTLLTSKALLKELIGLQGMGNPLKNKLRSLFNMKIECCGVVFPDQLHEELNSHLDNEVQLVAHKMICAHKEMLFVGIF